MADCVRPAGVVDENLHGSRVPVRATIGHVTRPGSRQPRPDQAKLAASLSGAVDLSGLKARADARASAARGGSPSGPGAASAGTSVDAAGQPIVIDITEANLEEAVLHRSMQVPVVVEFGSARAQGTVEMSSDLSELARADGGTWVHARVDVDASPQIAQVFQVQAVPTVIAVAGGRPLTDFEGIQTFDALRQWVDAILRAVEGKLEGPPASEPAPLSEDSDGPVDPEMEAAEELMGAGEYSAAAEAFETIFSQRPGDRDILSAQRMAEVLARVEGGQGEVDDSLDESFAAADNAAAQGEMDGAFAILVETIRSSAGDERKAAQKRLLQLFELLPANDPHVLTARRNLASALF